MSASTEFHVRPVADPVERLAWAQRRHAAAALEAEQAQRRLVAAREQLREARAAVRAARAGRATSFPVEEMIGLGYFADEFAHGEAA
jgi:hypothetical protein